MDLILYGEEHTVVFLEAMGLNAYVIPLGPQERNKVGYARARIMLRDIVIFTVDSVNTFKGIVARRV